LIYNVVLSLARCGVALVSEWLRASRFDVVAAYAAQPDCSDAARNHAVAGLLRAGLYNKAFPFVLDDTHRTTWSRVTLHALFGAVAHVQLNELSLTDFFVTAIAGDAKMRKRREKLLRVSAVVCVCAGPVLTINATAEFS
jgi:hypothetical protein